MGYNRENKAPPIVTVFAVKPLEFLIGQKPVQ